MKVFNATIGKSDAEAMNILNFLHINYPVFKFLTEKEYNINHNGVRYEMDENLLDGITVRLSIGDEGLSIDVPIDVLKKPNVSVIPVYIAENTAVDLNCVFDKFKGQKVNYGANAEKVYSFQNWEMRDGKVVVRDRGMMNKDIIIIIKS